MYMWSIGGILWGTERGRESIWRGKQIYPAHWVREGIPKWRTASEGWEVWESMVSWGSAFFMAGPRREQG